MEVIGLCLYWCVYSKWHIGSLFKLAGNVRKANRDLTNAKCHPVVIIILLTRTCKTLYREVIGLCFYWCVYSTWHIGWQSIAACSPQVVLHIHGEDLLRGLCHNSNVAIWRMPGKCKTSTSWDLLPQLAAFGELPCIIWSHRRLTRCIPWRSAGQTRLILLQRGRHNGLLVPIYQDLFGGVKK